MSARVDERRALVRLVGDLLRGGCGELSVFGDQGGLVTCGTATRAGLHLCDRCAGDRSAP